MRKLSIIIPCYNEEGTIHKLLDYLEEQEFPVEHEVIIVDDGSRVRLKPHIQLYLDKNENYRYYRFKHNQGKGSAIQIGHRKATGDYVIVQDADLEYLPKDIPNLLKPILEDGFKVVYGSRLLGQPEGMSISHNLGNRVLTWLTNILFRADITDMETGYKLVKQSIISDMHLEAREFELEPELTGKILLKGYRIKEVPITYQYRLKGQAKINAADGIEALLVLFKVRYFKDSKFVARVHKVLKFHFKRILGRIMKKLIPKDLR